MRRTFEPIRREKRGHWRRWPALWVRMRRLGLLVLFVVPGLLRAAEKIPFEPTLFDEIRIHCNEILLRGLFNGETYACVPGLRDEAESRLCTADPGELFLPFAAGFGSGPDLAPGAGAKINAALFQRWDWSAARSRTPLCSASTTVTLEMTGDPHEDIARVMRHWEPTRALLPVAVSGPWEACAAMQSQRWIERRAGVHCQAIGGFDTEGEDETVYFVAGRVLPPAALEVNLLFPFRRYRGPRLTADVEISGADCEGPRWRKGMRLSLSGALRCRRRGRSAVRFRVLTKKGECTAELPALVEPPLAESCPAPPRP